MLVRSDMEEEEDERPVLLPDERLGNSLRADEELDRFDGETREAKVRPEAEEPDRPSPAPSEP